MKLATIFGIFLFLHTHYCFRSKDSVEMKKTDWSKMPRLFRFGRGTDHWEELDVNNENDQHSDGDFEDFTEFVEDSHNEGFNNTVDSDSEYRVPPEHIETWQLFDEEEEEEESFVDEDQVSDDHNLFNTTYKDDEMDYNRRYILERPESEEKEYLYNKTGHAYETDDLILSDEQNRGSFAATPNLNPTESSEDLDCKEHSESPNGKPKRKKTKKKRKLAGSTSLLLIKPIKSTGKRLSKWKQNCCIRGKKVGHHRRTFLSRNLFQECKERSRNLSSRMSRTCKWIFWNCCEAKALRQYYIHTVKKIRQCGF